jgi:cysteine-rich repeat protein
MIRYASISLAVLLAGAADCRADVSLLLSQSAAFSVLGHSCGGIQEQAVATGFDPATGHATGAVYLQTRCGGSGRGGGYHVTTYSAWAAASWDLTGATVTFLGHVAPPAAIDPAFTAYDGFGNELYQTISAVDPSSCLVFNTTCGYHAWLHLADGFTPAPRVTAISTASGPASGATTVTIAGTGFTGASAVDFGATAAASFTVAGDTQIAAVSPAAAAGTVDITVTGAGGSSATSAADLFTFVGVPKVSKILPEDGPLSGGTEVTIEGSGFVDVMSVLFGESAVGFVVNDDTSITTTSPPGEALDTVPVKVVTEGGTSGANASARFTYTNAAAVCGNGIVDAAEQCDDGDTLYHAGDACTADCLLGPCGQPTSPDAPAPSAADAEFVLAAAVGAAACAPSVCDADGSGDVTTVDALLILRGAVGLDAALACPL